MYVLSVFLLSFLENDESVIVMVQRDVTDIMSEQEKQNAELRGHWKLPIVPVMPEMSSCQA